MRLGWFPCLTPALASQELEEEESGTVYDDYKFITKSELEDLGLEHLVGTALVRLHLTRCAELRPSDPTSKRPSDLSHSYHSFVGTCTATSLI